MDIVQFVDSVAASPTVRLNLNDGTTWGLKYDSDVSPPPLKTAWASTLLVDGERLTAAAFGNRTLKLALDLMTANPDAAAAQEQALWRELNRPSNLLKWQPEGATNPVFFQTIRSSANRVTDLPGSTTVLRLLDVQIEAKPFGIGLRETLTDPLNANTTFEAGVTPWTGQNGTVVQSSTFARTGSFSLRLTPTGGVSPSAARSESVPVVQGLPYVATVWMYSAAGYATGCSAAFDWFTPTGTFISSTLGTTTALPAGVWTQYQTAVVPPAGAGQAQIRARMAGTPAATDVVYVEDATLGLYTTVANDPGAAINGMCLDLGTIKGDADAPLYLQIRASDVNPVTFTIGEGRRTTAIAMRRGGTPSAMPAVLQAESMTVSGDTSLQAAIATSSGQFTRTTFAADTSLGLRMSTSAFPASPSVDARGQYRVFVRCRKSVDTDVVQIRMNYTTGGGTGVFTDTANVPSTGWRWVDLGVISIPLGYDPVTDGLSGVPVSVRGLLVNFSAGRVSGTGNLDVDVIMHMPADDRLCYIKWPQYGAQTSYVIDAVANQVYAIGSSGEVMGTMLEMDSLPPMVSPGVANRIWLMRDVGAEYVSGDDIAASVRVTPYYYPQYLRVRPATT